MLLEKWIFTFAAVSLLSFPAFGDELASLKGGYGVLKPAGELAVDGDHLAGTKVCLDDDLGFDDSKNGQEEAAFNVGPFRLTGNYMPLRFSGNDNLSETIRFNGEVFLPALK